MSKYLKYKSVWLTCACVVITAVVLLIANVNTMDGPHKAVRNFEKAMQSGKAENVINCYAPGERTLYNVLAKDTIAEAINELEYKKIKIIVGDIEDTYSDDEKMAVTYMVYSDKGEKELQITQNDLMLKLVDGSWYISE